MNVRFMLPLGGFAILVIFLAVGLTLDPKEVPSPFIGKPAPQFELPRLHESNEVIKTDDMKGKVWMLNVWASWCVSCRAEHEVVTSYTRMPDAVDVIGLNYKDDRLDALAWLRQFGNPYAKIAVDLSGRTGLDWGVYGVPETFVVDKSGTVRFKHIGPITEQSLHEKLMPLLEELQAEVL